MRAARQVGLGRRLRRRPRPRRHRRGPSEAVGGPSPPTRGPRLFEGVVGRGRRVSDLPFCFRLTSEPSPRAVDESTGTVRTERLLPGGGRAGGKTVGSGGEGRRGERTNRGRDRRRPGPTRSSPTGAQEPRDRKSAGAVRAIRLA